MERNTDREEERIYYHYDREQIKDIMRDSGSEAIQNNIKSLGAIEFYIKGKMITGIIEGKGFYVAGAGKNHARLYEIAVKKNWQGAGIGARLLKDLINRCKKRGLKYITLRTSRKEKAIEFYRKMGGEVQGINGEDYEVQLKL